MEDVFQKANKNILVRFSDQLSAIPEDGTIREHEKIIEKNGYVWIGKFGRTLGKNHIVSLTDQIKKSIPTYLFLVQTINKEYDVYVALMLDVNRKISKADLDSVPSYYRKNSAEIGVWFKVNKFKKMPNELLNLILISSSGMPASKTLKESMAGAFIIRLTKDTVLQDFLKKSATTSKK